MIRAERFFNVFIGYDSTQDEAYHVCRQSLIDVGVDPDMIVPLELGSLRKLGVYWRKDDSKASTEFAYTRFLVPFLSGYSGRSMFCDSDFLWRQNPLDPLLYCHSGHAITCVQHQLSALPSNRKMGGKVQELYPRKNWSSLMVFDNVQCTRLTPKVVSTEAASFLHQLQWAPGSVGSIEKKYNHLVGYKGYDHPDPIGVHFTDGVPTMPGCESVPFAGEWFDVQRRVKRERA